MHLGAKDKDEDQLTPTLVFGLKQAKVKFITAGYNHSVACGEADAEEFLENEISLNTDLSAEHLINTINSTTKTEKRRAAKKLALLCIKTGNLHATIALLPKKETCTNLNRTQSQKCGKYS